MEFWYALACAVGVVGGVAFALGLLLLVAGRDETGEDVGVALLVDRTKTPTERRYAEPRGRRAIGRRRTGRARAGRVRASAVSVASAAAPGAAARQLARLAAAGRSRKR